MVRERVGREALERVDDEVGTGTAERREAKALKLASGFGCGGGEG